MQHLHHYLRWQRLKYRWERLPKTHRFALMESGAGVLHIYGKTKALHHCGNYCTVKIHLNAHNNVTCYMFVLLSAVCHNKKMSTQQWARFLWTLNTTILKANSLMDDSLLDSLCTL